MDFGDLLGGAGDWVGSMVGYNQAKGDRQRQQDMQLQALKQWQDLKTPDLGVQQVSPDQIQGTELGKMDPASRNAMLSALQRFQTISREGGLDAQARAQNAQLQNGLAQQEQAQRGAISQNMAARGLSGSGSELAMQLQNQQGSANRGSQQGMDIAANAQQRALQALQGGMGAAQGLYGMDANRAAAQDRINAYNNQNANQAKYYNSGLYQQQFQDNLARAGGTSGAYNTMGGNYGQRANDTISRWRGEIGGAGRLAGGALDFAGQRGAQAAGAMTGNPAAAMGGTDGTQRPRMLGDDEYLPSY